MKKVLYVTVIILFMLITAGNTIAGDNTAIIQVRAKVMPIAKHTILHKESLLLVTRADINRGYVDINRAIVLSIKTNSANGYLLIFSAGSGLFSGLRVKDGNHAYNLPGSGGEVHMTYQGLNYVQKELSFRFHLLADVKPGIYTWPVALMVSAM